MKKRYIIVVLFVAFFSGSFSIAQVTKAEVIYNVKVFRKENTPRTKYSDEFDLIFKETENIRLQLLYNNGKSTFKEIEVLYVDYKSKYIRKIANIISDAMGKYYSDVKEKAITKERDMNGDIYNIVYKFDHYNWELIDETKTIDTYLCYKAVTQKTVKDRMGKLTELKITAWYTPQIPLPLGPKNYAGLPGLILELHEDTRRTYSISQLELNPKKKIKIDTPREGKKVTEKEFEKITAKAYGNFMDAMKKN